MKYDKNEVKEAWDLACDIKEDASTEFLLQATCDILREKYKDKYNDICGWDVAEILEE